LLFLKRIFVSFFKWGLFLVLVAQYSAFCRWCGVKDGQVLVVFRMTKMASFQSEVTVRSYHFDKPVQPWKKQTSKPSIARRNG